MKAAKEENGKPEKPRLIGFRHQTSATIGLAEVRLKKQRVGEIFRLRQVTFRPFRLQLQNTN